MSSTPGAQPQHDGGVFVHDPSKQIGMQALSSIIHLLGVSLLSHFLSRRIRLDDISSLHGLSQISYPRLLLVLGFLDSWAFLFTSGILIQGGGLHMGGGILCSLGILFCIGFYVTSKVFVYLFLVEKVHVVWSSDPATPRLKSRIYLLSLVVVSLYLVVATILVFGRISYYRADGMCVIGLKPTASILILSYDLFINIFLTLLFLWPFLRARYHNLYLRQVARRAMLAAFVALSISCANFLALTLLHGEELSWVCLGSCSVDVVINAIVLFWVTSGTSLRPQFSAPREGLGPTDGVFKENGTFLCITPSELKRLSQKSVPSRDPSTDAFGGVLLHRLSVPPSDVDLLGQLDERLGPIQNSSSVTVPQPVAAPSRVLRPFLTLTTLFGHKPNDAAREETQISPSSSSHPSYDTSTFDFDIEGQERSKPD